MAASYIALFTGFYVDNGPQLPLWDRLPHWTYWVIPLAIGGPLTARALKRNGALLKTHVNDDPIVNVRRCRVGGAGFNHAARHE